MVGELLVERRGLEGDGSRASAMAAAQVHGGEATNSPQDSPNLCSKALRAVGQLLS